MLSIIIVNYNVFKDVVLCIESIRRFLRQIDYEIIVVDNNSKERDIEQIEELFDNVKLILLEKNNGFGFANNIALKVAQGKYFLLVNPDIIFTDNSIEKLIKYLELNPDTGAVAPVQSKPNNGIEYYYSFFPTFYSRFAQEFGLYTRAPFMRKRLYGFWDENITRNIPFKADWVMGSCMLLRRDVYDSVGGFNEAFFLYEEEVEWQYRMSKKGWLSVVLPEAKVIHNHHSSTSKIGTMFVLYHEFRSRIIFSALQYNFPSNIIRKFLMICAICFRMFYYNIFDFRSGTVFNNRLYLYIDLIKMILTGSKKVLNSRYVFSQYALYFQGNGDAKL